MSRKRSKWKFSPARKRRPVEAASSEIPEIVIEEEVGAESLEIAAAEDKVEERSTERCCRGKGGKGSCRKHFDRRKTGNRACR